MTRPSPNNRRPFALLLLLCVAACVTTARGQQQAYKIDETDYTRCDLSEMNIVNDLGGAIFKALAERPEAKGAIGVYAPETGGGTWDARWRRGSGGRRRPPSSSTRRRRATP